MLFNFSAQSCFGSGFTESAPESRSRYLAESYPDPDPDPDKNFMTKFVKKSYNRSFLYHNRHILLSYKGRSDARRSLQPNKKTFKDEISSSFTFLGDNFGLDPDLLVQLNPVLFNNRSSLDCRRYICFSTVINPLEAQNCKKLGSMIPQDGTHRGRHN